MDIAAEAVPDFMSSAPPRPSPPRAAEDAPGQSFSEMVGGAEPSAPEAEAGDRPLSPRALKKAEHAPDGDVEAPIVLPLPVHAAPPAQIALLNLIANLGSPPPGFEHAATAGAVASPPPVEMGTAPSAPSLPAPAATTPTETVSPAPIATAASAPLEPPSAPAETATAPTETRTPPQAAPPAPALAHAHGAAVQSAREPAPPAVAPETAAQQTQSASALAPPPPSPPGMDAAAMPPTAAPQAASVAPVVLQALRSLSPSTSPAAETDDAVPTPAENAPAPSREFRADPQPATPEFKAVLKPVGVREGSQISLPPGAEKVELTPSRQESVTSLTALSAAAPQVGSGHTPVEHSRIPPPALQIAQEIIRRFDGGATSFDLRLDPPELGRVDVRLEVSRDHRVTANVAADTPQALAELMRHARELEQSLQSAGLTLSDNGLSFDLRHRTERDAETAALNDAAGDEDGDIDATSAPPLMARPIGFERWRGVRLDITV